MIDIQEMNRKNHRSLFKTNLKNNLMYEND